MSAYDAIYSRVKVELKSAKRMLARRERERGKLTVRDAMNGHAACSYWEGQLSALHQVEAYFNEIREAERKERKKK